MQTIEVIIKHLNNDISGCFSELKITYGRPLSSERDMAVRLACTCEYLAPITQN